MTGRRIVYEPWQSLDPGKRYRLIDTMDLLQVYRRDRRLTSMVEAVRDGRTMLLVPGVVDECAAVFHTHKPGAPPPEYPYAGGGRGNTCGRLAGPPARKDIDVEPGPRSNFGVLNRVHETGFSRMKRGKNGRDGC